MRGWSGWFALVTALVVLGATWLSPDLDLIGRVFGTIVAGVFLVVANVRRR